MDNVLGFSVLGRGIIFFFFDGKRALAGMHTCTCFTRLSLVIQAE
jgi:hypothetical protein